MRDSVTLPCWRVDFADGWTTASHAEDADEAVEDAAEVWRLHHDGAAPSATATRLPDEVL